jgi:hypothetical protein
MSHNKSVFQDNANTNCEGAFFLLGVNKKISVAWKEDISKRCQIQRKLRKTIEI